MSDHDDDPCTDDKCSCKAPGWKVRCTYANGDMRETTIVVPDATALANFIFVSTFAAERMGIHYEVKIEIIHTPRPGKVDAGSPIPDFLPPEI